MILECENCEAKTKCEEIGSYTESNPYDPIDAQKYSLFKCLECSSPILISERFYETYNGTGWSKPKIIYPLPEFHINPLIPNLLSQALKESIQCYKTGAYSATAIMCRRAIEGFCTLKNVKEVNLNKSLSRLLQEGFINNELYQWADQLRISGNDAAHNIESNFTQEDAKDILDFTIAIFDFSFSFREKFDNFVERKRT